MKKLLIYIVLVLMSISCGNQKKTLIERSNIEQEVVDSLPCATHRKVCVISESLADLIKKETANETKTNFEGESRVVYLRFYQLNGENYLILSTAPGYSDKAEKFCIFENKLLIIDDVNGTLSRKFINFEMWNIADIPDFYDDMSECTYDPRHKAKYYRILSETKFVEFQPDREHSWELFNLLVDEEKILLPPPPPDATPWTREEEFRNLFFREESIK